MIRTAHINSGMNGMPEMCDEMGASPGGPGPSRENWLPAASTVVGLGPSLHFKFALAIANEPFKGLQLYTEH